jgi:glyoxylase-like metal-dependent hydrolase (beta-lactamase superfamily II)
VLDGGLEVEWLLETHVHADHLSAAPYLQEKLGGTLAIGRHITEVQATFATIFNEGPALPAMVRSSTACSMTGIASPSARSRP